MCVLLLHRKWDLHRPGTSGFRVPYSNVEEVVAVREIDLLIETDSCVWWSAVDVFLRDAQSDFIRDARDGSPVLVEREDTEPERELVLRPDGLLRECLQRDTVAKVV